MKTILLTFALFAALKASALTIVLPPDDNQNHLYDFKITMTGGDFAPGATLQGQMLFHPSGPEAYLVGGKFDFYDPVTGEHHVSHGIYGDDRWITTSGGNLRMIGEHPRWPMYLHETQFGFNATGVATGQVWGGWFEGGGDPWVDIEEYRYDFVGSIELSAHIPPEPRNIPTVPETNSTLALLGVVGGLMVGIKKRLQPKAA